jgi:hypothetical protein
VICLPQVSTPIPVLSLPSAIPSTSSTSLTLLILKADQHFLINTYHKSPHYANPTVTYYILTLKPIPSTLYFKAPSLQNNGKNIFPCFSVNTLFNNKLEK